jgi:hypothetical protein
MKRFVSAGMLIWLVTACSAPTPPPGVWVKTRDSAGDLDVAKDACKRRAAKETATVKPDSVATRLAIQKFRDCMKEQGWSLQPEQGAE